MNACEDETEPLGESPDIDTLAAINRAAEIGMLSAGDKALATKQLAERQTQALNKVREIHKPFKIYGECDCTDVEQGDEQTHVDVEEVGRTCNLLYQICQSCCLDGDSQSEDCACGHDHGPGKPICPTIRALDQVGA
ncbi:hypothetical protein [Mycolicibacterium fortuitum]